MAWADLSAQAQDGLTYAATTIKNPDGTPKYANGKAYMDFIAEVNGQEFYTRKIAERDAKRLKKLTAEANAALAAQVDALPD
jgi:hypothetical protein